jgi:hypothetical protein
MALVAARGIEQNREPGEDDDQTAALGHGKNQETETILGSPPNVSSWPK